MAKRDRILILDIGSTAIHAGEFEYLGSGGLVLHSFCNVEYTENLTEANRTMVIGAALRRALEDGKFSTQRCSICVSGQAAFMRFVKLPPVSEEESRVRQIVEYEARQNVPFPMEEVIWDYQLIGSDEEELEVMFAVIKNDIVEGVIRAVTDLDMQPNLVDFAPAALYNAARANYIGEEECAMLLDIGGRCTNLLFLDGNRFFARAIPIAGFTITQQIAKEFGISTDEAEILKRRHGFVALGGAYEEPESEVAATISKIIRNVMTRLHGEINRSINVYRTQQKGNKPTHLFLSGGSSTMAFTDHFFSEKLRMEVSYFNPFKVVALDESLDTQRLQEVAHMFPEVVGVALRNAVECPVEISLITESIRKHQLFTKRRPFLIISCVVWLLVLLVWHMVNNRRAELYRSAFEDKKGQITKLDSRHNTIRNAQKEMEADIAKYNRVGELLARRTRWTELYNEVQKAKPIDLWIQHIKPAQKPLQDPEKAKAKAEATATEAVSEEDFFTQGGITTTETQATDQFEWFDLFGYCVRIPEVNDDGSFSRPVFSNAQWQLLRPVAMENVAQTKDAGGDDAQKYVELGNVIASGNRVQPSTNLPKAFVEALRMCPLFSDDRYETNVVAVSIDVAEEFENVWRFRIQVKLRTPISTSMP